MGIPDPGFSVSLPLPSGLLDHMQDSGLRPEQQQCVAVALQQSGECLGVLNKVLDLAKTVSGKLHPEQVEFHVQRWVEETAEEFAEEARAQGLECKWGGTMVQSWHSACRALHSVSKRSSGLLSMRTTLEVHRPRKGTSSRETALNECSCCCSELEFGAQ